MQSESKRLADYIAGMDYVQPCRVCCGNGSYEQTYTAGCGMGYYRMDGDCRYCGSTGIVTDKGDLVPPSVVAQIRERMADAA